MARSFSTEELPNMAEVFLGQYSEDSSGTTSSHLFKQIGKFSDWGLLMFSDF